MDDNERRSAEAHAVAQIEANDQEVESVHAVRKSRDSYLVTVELKGWDGERQMVVPVAEL